MGFAFGLLGSLTFAAMFGLGYCLTSRKGLQKEIDSLKHEIGRKNK